MVETDEYLCNWIVFTSTIKNHEWFEVWSYHFSHIIKHRIGKYLPADIGIGEDNNDFS